jgi:hypothetical protein
MSFSRAEAAHPENILATLGVADLPRDDGIKFGLADWAGSIGEWPHAPRM